MGKGFDEEFDKELDKELDNESDKEFDKELDEKIDDDSDEKKEEYIDNGSENTSDDSTAATITLSNNFPTDAIVPDTADGESDIGYIYGDGDTDDENGEGDTVETKKKHKILRITGIISAVVLVCTYVTVSIWFMFHYNYRTYINGNDLSLIHI